MFLQFQEISLEQLLRDKYLIKSGAFVATEPSDILEYYGFKDTER